MTQIRHPAKFSKELLPVLGKHIVGYTRILDPFAGVGGIFALQPYAPACEIHAIELEPEWQNCHPATRQGNALYLDYPDNYFPCVITSPTFANRLADKHNAKDSSKRNGYKHCLGRDLHPDNSGQLQWGEKYKLFHIAAWLEVRRVLEPGGVFVLNMKDHIRAGKQIAVTDWHIEAATTLGFTLEEHEKVYTPGLRYGANSHLRMPYDSVIKFVSTKEA